MEYADDVLHSAWSEALARRRRARNERTIRRWANGSREILDEGRGAISRDR